MNNKTNGKTILTTEVDKNKDWQLEIFMEKLRSKASQFKSFADISKNVRMTMLDKRYSLDSVEKSQHQKCLDLLQNSIKVTSLQSMVERLESLTRQLGLKFMVGPSDIQLFISSDMFYLEILLDNKGSVQDVKVHHEGKMEQQSCAELVSCLSRGDFQDFTTQLESFASIYQLNAEKKIKSKAYTALQSLESDLSHLAQLQSLIKEPSNLVYKSPVGILEERKGGHPMKLTYFVSPYEFIDTDKLELEPINIEKIISQNLGYSVTVCMEGSAAHKLQTTTLITVSRSINGKSSPSFSPLNCQNSSVIPATFVLKLNKSLPICVALAQQLHTITELEWVDFSTKRPLLDLIVSFSSDNKLRSENNKGLFVNLPEQNHCYFMTDNKNMDGIILNSIPFTHPAKVSQVLVLLRQQALFNTLITSCVRPDGRQNFENIFMLEITALSWTHISISLEHPNEEYMATAELDLTEISRLTCKIHTPGTPLLDKVPDTVSELATQVLNKSFSIPVMIRSIIKFWERQSLVRRNHFSIGSNGHENFSLPLDSCDPGGGSGSNTSTRESGGSNLPEFHSLNTSGTSTSGNRVKEVNQTQSMFFNDTNFQDFPSSEKVLELFGSQGNDKNKRSQKRFRVGEDLWKSKNRKMGDDDILLETSSSSDSTSGSFSFSQQDTTDLTSNSASLGFPSDQELSMMDPSDLTMKIEKIGCFENKDVDKNEKTNRNLVNKSSIELISELEDNSVVSTGETIFNQSGLIDRRPSTDLSAMITSQTTLLPSSTTIMPISQNKSTDDKYKERKSSKIKIDDKNKMDKKKKKKRDESPMGPPDKIPSKQDPLLKPISLNMKSSESPPLPLSTPSSPGISKYSASPTHRSLGGKLSPNLAKQTLKGQSPKHSPAYVPSSPKNHGASPKHPSTSGTGKPSMSTLKNVTNSPNSKSDSKLKSTYKDSSRDKEKKMSSQSSSSGSSKNKSSSKTKFVDLNVTTDYSTTLEEQISPGGNSDSKNNAKQVSRKSTLNAIVDKLKSAQHCEIITDPAAKINNKIDRNTGSNPSCKSGDNKSCVMKSTGDNKNSEYMVKSSSDGIKLTINKTRTKDSIKSSGCKTGSPKIHTGLKPGVNSGPASKKPLQQQQIQNQKSSSSATTNFKNIQKLPLSNSKSSTTNVSSFSNLSNKSKIGTNSQNKDKFSKMSKSFEKNLFSSKERGKSSPTPREEQDASYKFNPLKMDGLKNFQIPKLSARQAVQLDDKKTNTKVDNTIHLNRSPSDSKIYDLINKNESKYPLAIPNNKMLASIDMEAKIRSNMNSISPTPPQLNRKDTCLVDDDENNTKNQHGLTFPISSTLCPKPFGPNFTDQPLSLTMKTSMDIPKFVTPEAPHDKKDVKKPLTDCDLLLDFSKGSEGSKTTPSVSVHIVKSPAAHPSPREISPRLTDDEIMDETIVGLGK